MSPRDLERFLCEKIPLTKALEIKILHSGSDYAEIAAPLKPNINHFGTVFGGSLHSVLILSCYSWLFNLLEENGFSTHVVLKSSTVKHAGPVQKDFSAICKSPEPEATERFIKTMQKKKRAQITLKSSVQVDGKTVCELEGEFVGIN